MTVTEWQAHLAGINAAHGFQFPDTAGADQIDAFRWLNVEAETNTHAALLVPLIRQLWDENKSLWVDRKLLLAIGELVEAQNEMRNYHGTDAVYYTGDKPEGVGIEITDAVIRLFNLVDDLGMDMESLLRMKSDYNETRPFKHGGKAF
jgi:hypothetical protein